MKGSAGKFCTEKWTRKREEKRVEEEDHEEVGDFTHVLALTQAR
jgi:hypothetical protein